MGTFNQNHKILNYMIKLDSLTLWYCYYRSCSESFASLSYRDLCIKFTNLLGINLHSNFCRKQLKNCAEYFQYRKMFSLIKSKIQSVYFQVFILKLFQSYVYTYYGNTDYGVSSQGIQNQTDFLPKINIPKGNYLILRIGCNCELSKIGHHFCNEVI